jgi:3-hydroxyisobutyrate dehydrogenase
MKVGVIGAGAMGQAMVGHLIRRGGFEVAVFDVSEERMGEAAALGARRVESLDAMGGAADVILVMVATDRQVLEVADGLLPGARRGALIAVTASVHPETVKTLAERAGAARARVIDAPVCHGLSGAREGRLVSLCGGAAADVEAAREVLLAYSRAVYHIGPLGAGQIAKTANNMLHWAACVANYEVLCLAKRNGLDAQKLREVLLDCPGRNGTLEHWDSTRFTWPEKDLDIALDLAQGAGLTLPLFGLVDQLIKLLSPRDVSDLLYGEATRYLGRAVAKGSDAKGPDAEGSEGAPR